MAALPVQHIKLNWNLKNNSYTLLWKVSNICSRDELQTFCHLALFEYRVRYFSYTFTLSALFSNELQFVMNYRSHDILFKIDALNFKPWDHYIYSEAMWKEVICCAYCGLNIKWELVQENQPYFNYVTLLPWDEVQVSIWADLRSTDQ